jgi:hypothetical protein
MLLAAALLSIVPLGARAHCDTLDGPVVKTARAALDANTVAPVLAWVKPNEEQQIRAAFRRAIDARKKNPASHDLSDRQFFETLVRVHRAGEGAAYTGLKPDGAGVAESVHAADRAIEKADSSDVEQMLVEAVRPGLRHRFATLTARQPPGEDVAAGRAWVEAYVDYVHYVERLDAAARSAGDHHAGETGHHLPARAPRPSTTAKASDSHAHAH